MVPTQPDRLCPHYIESSQGVFLRAFVCKARARESVLAAGRSGYAKQTRRETPSDQLCSRYPGMSLGGSRCERLRGGQYIALVSCFQFPRIITDFIIVAYYTTPGRVYCRPISIYRDIGSSPRGFANARGSAFSGANARAPISAFAHPERSSTTRRRHFSGLRTSHPCGLWLRTTLTVQYPV